MIDARRVTVGGAPADRPARLVAPGEAVTVTGPPPRFVSRGGEKLDAALDQFGLDVAGLRALDAGASTGGFTDCLLARGARQVVALDVGRNQLHESLRANPAVLSMERTNLRGVGPADVGGTFEVVVADLSFISLRTVARPLVALANPGAPLVVLVKPQFEAGRRHADRGRGVIRDPQLWRDALEGARNAFGDAGAAIMGAMVSPLRGAGGNVEFLVYLRRGWTLSGLSVDPGTLLDAIVATAVAGTGRPPGASGTA